jgi:hypothetical protein
MTQPLDDDALRRLLAMPSVPASGTMLFPLVLRVPPALLRDLCRLSLDRVRAERGEGELPLRARIEAARVEQQHVDFLGWLQGVQEEELRLSVYPTGHDGMEDVDELMSQGDDLPF